MKSWLEKHVDSFLNSASKKHTLASPVGDISGDVNGPFPPVDNRPEHAKLHSKIAKQGRALADLHRLLDKLRNRLLLTQNENSALQLRVKELERRCYAASDILLSGGRP